NEEMRGATTCHIIKTIKTLALQFFFTFSCILLTTFVPIIYNFVLRYIFHVFCLGAAGSLLTILFMAFSERKTDGQLAMFTLFETIVVCVSSIFYGETTVALGLLITIGLTAGLACYALTINKNYANMGAPLYSALSILTVL